MDTSHNPHPDSIDVRQNYYASRDNGAGAGDFDSRYTGLHYRAVRWQAGWPPQEDVPHAGSTVYVDGEPHTVQTGIPTISGSGGDEEILGLDLFDSNGHTWWWEIDEISLTPPAPERAEGEIVGTLQMSPNGFFSVDLTNRDPAPNGYVVIRRDS